MCFGRLVINEENAGIAKLDIPHQGYENQEIQDFIVDPDLIMFVGIELSQIELENFEDFPIKVVGLANSLNNDCSNVRFKAEPNPTPSIIASAFEVGLKDYYLTWNQIYPGHIIIYRNIREETELSDLQAEHGEIHEIKSVIRRNYGEWDVKFSYVAVVSNYSGSVPENVEIVPNGLLVLNPDLMVEESTTACLTLATSSDDYDLNELVLLTSSIWENSEGEVAKPMILETAIRFTKAMGELLITRTLQRRAAQAGQQAQEEEVQQQQEEDEDGGNNTGEE